MSPPRWFVLALGALLVSALVPLAPPAAALRASPDVTFGRGHYFDRGGRSIVVSDPRWSTNPIEPIWEHWGPLDGQDVVVTGPGFPREGVPVGPGDRILTGPLGGGLLRLPSGALVELSANTDLLISWRQREVNEEWRLALVQGQLLDRRTLADSIYTQAINQAMEEIYTSNLVILPMPVDEAPDESGRERTSDVPLDLRQVDSSGLQDPPTVEFISAVRRDPSTGQVLADEVVVEGGSVLVRVDVADDVQVERVDFPLSADQGLIVQPETERPEGVSDRSVVTTDPDGYVRHTYYAPHLRNWEALWQSGQNLLAQASPTFDTPRVHLISPPERPGTGGFQSDCSTPDPCLFVFVGPLGGVLDGQPFEADANAWLWLLPESDRAGLAPNSLFVLTKGRAGRPGYFALGFELTADPDAFVRIGISPQRWQGDVGWTAEGVRVSEDGQCAQTATGSGRFQLSFNGRTTGAEPIHAPMVSELSNDAPLLQISGQGPDTIVWTNTPDAISCP